MNSELLPDIRKVLLGDPDYPTCLRDVDDPPEVLYIRGRWPLPEGCRIGIVGTRQASAYGIDVTKRLTRDLVEQGVVTVSGLAAGIDACAHQTTLEAGGWTIAVLGHGFGFQYPKENARLYDQIAERGTLVTEFSFDTGPQAANFPRRNRIISGLSQGVLVVEAGHRSGASITARYAAEQGREVFVVPGSIFSTLSRGCHRLIKEGATLVESADAILEEYGLSGHRVEVNLDLFSHGEPALKRITPEDRDKDLSTVEKEVMHRISRVPLSVDELVELSAMPIDRLAEVLLSLELKGRIKSLPGNLYVTHT